MARHAQGYPAAIDAGALTVMAGFSSWNGVKNHGNASLLTDVLKRRMGFAGLGSPDHLALAREAAARSLVLLKNNDGVLPVRPGARVLIAGFGADSMAMQAGGWTITWQGTDTTAVDFPNGQTIGHAIAAAVDAAGGQATLAPDGKWSARPDVAIVVYGEQPYAEFQGDRPNLAFRPREGEQELIARLKAQGIRVVSVFLSGRPLFTGPEINATDAFVAAWLPGTQGAGLADVLMAGRNGKPSRDFTGRLPFPWPTDAASPVRNALFPAGYGLGYAHPAKLGKVNEDRRVDLVATASEDTYLSRGMVPSPCRLTMDAAVMSRAMDLAAQEDARQFAWQDAGAIAIDGPPVDLMRQLDEGFVLRFDWRIDAAPVGAVNIAFGGGALDLGAQIRAAPVGTSVETFIPLRCFKEAGADIKAVGTPVRIVAAKGFVATLRNARIEATGASISCPPRAR